MLLLTTLIWGTSFPLLKQALTSLTPATILAVRFAVAAIAFVPWLRQIDGRLLRSGLLLGCVYFTECACAVVGLETITANRSAFIVSLNALLVPVLAVVLGRQLSGRVFWAAGLAIIGIGIMSWEGGGFSQGDGFTVACAVGIAVYILLLENIAPRHSTLPLVAVQLWVMAGLSLVWALPQLAEKVEAIIQHIGKLLYLGLVVTATPIWTQAMAQRWVAAQEAALIYTLEPVFATIFSFWLLGEALGIRGLLGAALVLVAIGLNNRRNEAR